MSRPGVLFDVDGTLVDSTYIHVMAWHHVFQDYDVIVPMRRIHQLIGMGADMLVEEAAGRALDGATDRHADHYRRLRVGVQPLAGALDLLSAVHELGLGVVLASSAGRDDVDDAINRLGAADVIDGSTASDDAEQAKPSPDILQAALDIADLDPQRTVAVGDATWDVKAAQQLGLPTIAFLSGGIPEADLREAGAVEVYQGPADLLAELSNSLIAMLGGH
ncbi:MAG: HAD family hydrolase [Actinomycetota bacterium]|nr:HAD family hydrolase [Actinomycetota bacterium]